MYILYIDVTIYHDYDSDLDCVMGFPFSKMTSSHSQVLKTFYFMHDWLNIQSHISDMEWKNMQQ